MGGQWDKVLDFAVSGEISDRILQEIEHKSLKTNIDTNSCIV